MLQLGGVLQPRLLWVSAAEKQLLCSPEVIYIP